MFLTSRDDSHKFIEAIVTASPIDFRLTGRACEGKAAKTNRVCCNGSVYALSAFTIESVTNNH